MLPFFRKIRYRLAKNNQFFKYSRYAFGEIVLVVVGILIALYINNWNENRKEREKFDQTLVEVQKELIGNIKEVRRTLKSYGKIDSELCKILLDTLAIEEYYDGSKQYELFALGFEFDKARLSNNSFKRLTEYNNFDERQDSILQQLTILNMKRQNILNDISDWMEKTMQENRQSIKKYTWYHDWAYQRWDNEEMQNYFRGDPEYINMTTNYSLVAHKYSNFLNVYDKEGLSNYRQINKYLIDKNLQLTDTLLFEYQPEIYKHYLGKYTSEWCSLNNYVHEDSIVISLEENTLTYTGYKSDRRNTRIKIIPVDKYLFRTESRAGFYHLEFDDHEEVTGIRFSIGPSFILTMKKFR